MAFTSMLEARIRIKYGQDVGLSSQFTLDCNWLTEGCQGGWGILAGFFTDFFHIVSDMCVPYTGTTGTNCQNYKHCEPLARTLSTYFVGGKYGQMTEELIIREIRANGPVMLDFAAGNDFLYYGEGVLVDNDQVHLNFLEQKKKREINEKTGEANDLNFDDYHLQWQKITHATLIIGWGWDEASQMKYWLVRNSYGPRYGLEGNFKLRRG
jgi:hypothetical protein